MMMNTASILKDKQLIQMTLPLSPLTFARETHSAVIGAIRKKKKKTDKEKQNKKVTNSKEKPFKCDVAYGKGYRVQKPMPSPCFPCMLACNPAISFQPLYFSLHRNSYPFSCRKFNPASRSA